MKTIVLANQKGGVAKTTTAMALAEGLAELGHRVLLIDCDPQCNSTSTYGATVENTTTLYDVLCGGSLILEAIQHTDLGAIVPCDPLLSAADAQIVKLGKEQLLRKALEEMNKFRVIRDTDGDDRELYDYCVIDTHPSLGILLINALTAADEVIVPLTADAYSRDGLNALVDTIHQVKEYTNPKIGAPKLLITKWSSRTKLSRRFLEELPTIAEGLQAEVLPMQIRECVAARAAQDQQRGLLASASRSTVAEDYRELARFVCGMEG